VLEAGVRGPIRPAPAEARGEGVRARERIRRRVADYLSGDADFAVPRAKVSRAACARAHPDAPLRREPRPTGGVLRGLGVRAGSRRSAAPRQGALVQQPARPRRRVAEPGAVRAHSRAAVCIIKHTTPCGLGVAETRRARTKGARDGPHERVRVGDRGEPRGRRGDRRGSCRSCSSSASWRPVRPRTPWPRLTKKKNVRLLSYPERGPVVRVPRRGNDPDGRQELPRSPCRVLRLRRHAGADAPEPPFYGEDDPTWKVASEAKPDRSRVGRPAFAWAAIFGVKSNAILLARDGAALGIGAGQMSRVDSSKIAVRKAGDAGHDLEGSRARLRRVLPVPGRRGRRGRGGRAAAAVIQHRAARCSAIGRR
jgi:hypothetical protein